MGSRVVTRDASPDLKFSKEKTAPKQNVPGKKEVVPVGMSIFYKFRKAFSQNPGGLILCFVGVMCSFTHFLVSNWVTIVQSMRN